MATLTFLGAAQQVTGSCYLLEAPGLGRVLLDCGLHQGSDAKGEDDLGQRLTFGPRSLDAVILSHAHLDHSGMLPVLVAQGFDGPIHCTRATARMLEVMLNDSAGLYEKDLEWDNIRRQRRGEEPLKPAYTRKDVARVLRLCKPIRFEECLPLGSGASVCFHDAGHILGSAIVEVKFTEQGRQRTFIFSGDLGKSKSALMNPPTKLKEADVVMMEGTYGNRNHRPMDATVAQFEQILHETWTAKGNVMIPAFAIGRSQEILYYLSRLHAQGKLDHWQIFLDSPMAVEITGLYEDCADLMDEAEGCRLRETIGPSMKKFLPGLHYTKTQEESRAINRIDHGALVIAGSGMCTGGRIRHHFKQRIWNQRNTIIFCGFQARGTLGRILVDGAKKISMFGEEFVVRARIETLGGFSAHADQSDLIEWITHYDPKPRVLLVHGEPSTLNFLSEKLWNENGLRSEVPYPGQVLQI